MACSPVAVVNTNNLPKYPPSPTPIPEQAVPSHWKALEIGPFEILGPDNMKKKDVHGIDSEVYEYENEEFSFDIEIGVYECVDGKPDGPLSENENGSIMINGKAVKFTKSDVNKPRGYAATNCRRQQI